VALYRDCVARWPAIQFQASGGVRDAADLAALAEAGVAATVSGKALLEGRLEPEELKPFLRGA
jgi:phosphoribosylformimino-5-aminoimidazole carboxamide ribotide isomerase